MTWAPVSALRRFTRGYDQSALLADALGRELDMPVVRTLRKIRHTPPQSSIRDAAKRRINVLGAYKVADNCITGKRIILVDDVITTGATASECARVLLSAGAKEVFFAAVAATEYDKK